MQRYRVQLSYRVDPGLPERGALFAADWGPGLHQSVVAHGQLSVTATIRAASPQVAAALVDARVGRLWRLAGQLPARPIFVDVRTARRLVLAGRVIRGEHFVGPTVPGRRGPDDDDGGSAGVREPRRPLPAPPSLTMALDEPLPEPPSDPGVQVVGFRQAG